MQMQTDPLTEYNWFVVYTRLYEQEINYLIHN